MCISVMRINVGFIMLFQVFGVTYQQAPKAVLGQTHVTIKEDAVIETPLTSISCEQGGGGGCICNIASTAPPAAPFDVWRLNAGTDFEVFYVGQHGKYFLDYSSATSYKLEIVCNENFVDSNPVWLEVDVLPNLHPVVPDWPSVTNNVTSKVLARTPVYSVEAADPENDSLTYVMTQIPSKNYFTISSNGKIAITVDSSSVAVDSVICQVNVSDGSNTVSLTVVFEFPDRMHSPIIENLPKNISIPEDAGSGHLLTTLTVTDPDNHIPVTDCHVIHPAAEDYKFQFDSSSLQLTVSKLFTDKKLFDFDHGTRQYVINCVATDGHLMSEVGIVTVDIVNVHERPVFDSEFYYCTLDESLAKTSQCDPGINVTAPDSKGGVTYALKTSISSLFHYNISTGRLTFAKDYDVDENVMPASANVTIVATDDIGMSSSATIQITVRDVNDRTCRFQNNSLLTQINSSTSLGVIDALHADDSDLTSPNNDVIYEAVAGDTTHFRILPDGRVVYSREVSSREEEQVFQLTVRCLDGGQPPRSAVAMYAVHFRRDPRSLWDIPAFVGVFSAMLALLVLCLALLLHACCARSCGACACALPTPSCSCRSCRDLRPPCSRTAPDKASAVEEDVDNFQVAEESGKNNNFRNIAWMDGDCYEAGAGINTPKSDLPT